MSTKISIDELIHVTTSVLRSLKAEGYSEINIDVDFYWSIDKEELYNPYKEPHDFTLGQITDDWEEIQKIASGERALLPHHLIWLAEILKSVGYAESSK